ncbi:excisionase family DNA-binding protein [Parafrankia sp. FMc2]|uniref:excisionase family DNA-binding protein n=1 Tax=Parafrankia sp. FMc2 TaxID=3233196 RepID=UPI0034D60391
MLRLEQAARRAGVDVSTILRWIEDEQLPAWWTSTGWRMDAADVDTGVVQVLASRPA